MKKNLWIGVLALVVLGACGGRDGYDHEAEDHDMEAHGQGREQGNHETGEIILSPEKAKAAGVEVEKIGTQPFRRVIPASGQILAAQGEEQVVVANTAGVVSFSRTLVEGVPVTKGSELFRISGGNIQDGDPMERARIAYETAKAEYERASKLAESRIVSQKEFNAIKETYENARIAYEALSSGKGGKGAAVPASLSGYVKSCLVKEGDYVSVGQPLLTVTQARRLLLRAEVSERYYTQLRGIVSANFRTPYDGQTHVLDSLGGRLLSYGRSAGGDSFYIPVTFEFDNRGDILSGAFVEVRLLSASLSNVISVPVSALTEEQGVNFVYLQEDEECYRKQEVKTGMDDGSRIEILSGLKAGDKVVTRGAIHVKLASAGNAIPGHTHNH